MKIIFNLTKNFLPRKRIKTQIKNGKILTITAYWSNTVGYPQWDALYDNKMRFIRKFQKYFKYKHQKVCNY